MTNRRATAALVLLTLSCGDGGPTIPPQPPPRVVTSIAVTPAGQTVTWIGATRQFTAVVRDQDGAVMAGVALTWSSSQPAVATVHPTSGLTTAAANGTTTVSAAAGTVTGGTSLTVQQVVAAMTVTPGLDTLLAAGLGRTFTAAAADSGGTAVAGVPVRWSSSNTAVATIDSLTGAALSAGHGTATMTARVGAVTAGATLVVRTIGSIDVTPGNPTLNWIGQTRPFAATVRDAGGVAMAGVAVTWSSTQPSVALVNASGVATAAANGTTTVSAAAGTVTGGTTLTVQQVVATITVTPGLDTLLAAGQTRTFSAVARDSGNTPMPGVARWSSATTSVATIDSLTGTALAAGSGTATITARVGTVTRNATLVVRNGVLVGNRVLLTDYGNVNDNDYIVDDYFVVWWHGAYNWSVEAQQILNWLKGVKAEALQLGLAHPPNDSRGTYLNVYLHEPGPGNDNYPDGWGAGVGTDGNGLPFLSVGSAQRNEPLLFRHEGFHLYQYTGSRLSPGFEYVGDGSWYVEASATWFGALPYATDVNTQRGAATVPANPQLALWHGWTNPPSGDPVNWNRTTRQYALSTWLDYLTTTGAATAAVLVGGYIVPTTMLPQEYLNSRVPGLGAIFADFAAASTPDMPYLTRPQWTLALQDMATYGDAADRNEYVLQLVDAGTGGAYVQPAAALLPRGWSYNVIRVSSTQAASWRFEVDGSPTGSGGAAAVFQARLLVRTASGDTVHTVPLANALDGFINVTTGAAATEMYLIVVAVPLHFRGHQTYAYGVKIDRT